ncbi:MAG TPA: hypothetical protein VJ501_01140 [Burkholderiaceae bacterium]|nr:hypothetical protein [Burkholderiaceae bacterium]
MKKSVARKSLSAGSRTTGPAVRPQVRGLLERSAAYRSLPPEKRRQVAHDTVRVASYLADPDRLVSREFANPVLSPNDLLAAVNFPSFVAGLINGVFGAIVNASMQQMEAYAKLVAHASKSVSDFTADTITDGKARAELVETFPHLFCRSGNGRLRLAAGRSFSRSDLAHLRRTLGLRRSSPGLDSQSGLRDLVQAVRRRTARERQRALALALSMGINRIVVTDGRIAAR